MAVLCLLLTVLAAGCATGTAGKQATSGNYLKVGVRTNLDTFSAYQQEADTYYGYEADLARQLAIAMGYDGVQYVGLDAAEREAALTDGRVDVLIAAYSYTEERAERFDLSEPYYQDAGRVMVEKSTLFTGYQDLKGTTVAVRTGTDARENLIHKLYELGLIKADTEAAAAAYLTITEMETYDAMNAALEYGTVDAVCADGCITLPWLDETRCYFEEPVSSENYVIATVKGSALTAKVSTALAELTDNGTVARLMVKWGVGE